MKYNVVETFTSINGEGQKAGELAVFIRLAGCNLNCSYCDTMWANQPETPYTGMTKQELAQVVRDAAVRNVTVTGGEPLMQSGIRELLMELGRIPNLRIEIETNGSIDIREYSKLPVRPCFTLDYKLPGSGMDGAMNVENYQYLTMEDAVKFVVSDAADLDRARDIIMQYQLQGRCGIYLSPVFGRIEPVEIVNYMMKHQLNQVRVQLQLHKFIWHPDQRGV